MSQYAILSNKEGRKATTRPIPNPQAHEVLIKNVAIASNPKDWKIPLWFPDWQDKVEGNDVAGYIEAVGEGVTTLKVGQKVAAFSRMMTDSDFGAYQEYTLAPDHCTFPLSDNVSFESAATLPLAVMTACIGLYLHLDLPLPSYPPKPVDQWIAVNGASSSVGAFAVQLAKLSGLKVLGTAGGALEYAKEQGLDAAVNYKEFSGEELVKKLQDEFKGKGITKVFDAISTPETSSMLAKALQPSGGLIAVVLPVPAFPEELQSAKSTQIQVGTSYSKERNGTNPQNTEFARKWYAQIGSWLNQGIFKGNAVQRMPNGLDSVDEGMRLLQNDKVSGKKLVYVIADRKQS